MTATRGWWDVLMLTGVPLVLLTAVLCPLYCRHIYLHRSQADSLARNCCCCAATGHFLKV